MRTGPPASLLAGAAGWAPRMSAWLDGRLLAEAVPVHRGRLTADASQQVPERLTFSVPRWDGRDWLPGGDVEHPLARFGQYVVLTIVVTSPVTGAEHETVIGRFQIQSWKHDVLQGLVQVEAVGVLQIAADDRISALYEIADAWPARLRTDQWGQISVLPALPAVPIPVARLTDGEGGTVVGTTRTDSRDHAYNRVVVRASGTDTANRPPIQAVVDQTTGPMRVGGPYRTVTKYWSSPLITTLAQAQASGATMLTESLRPSRTIPVTIAPDPRLELDDAVEIISDGTRDWGYITAYDLPLTVADGEMRIDVGVGA